jgi:putative peptide zinc metalloprotease protein
LAFSLPLLNPSPLFERLHGLGRLLFSTPAWWIWLAVTLWATVSAASHWPALHAHAHELLATQHGLLIAWLIYPLIKTMHECAHGLAVHRFGGRVQNAGVTLMMLTPVPFVNASAADAFRSRRQRILVSAAGIMVEMFLAALALMLWLIVEPGFVRDLALSVMFIGGVSTLLVNGNPLMRFDGYYALCDALDLRNLATRSGRYWIGLLNHRLLGLTATRRLEPLPGERPWLLVYAPLSWSYRLALTAAILLWVGGHSTLLGVAAAVLAAWTFLAQPLWRIVRHLREIALHDDLRRRPLLRAALLACAVALLIGVLPLPFNTLAEGVVWLPAKAQVRARTSGFVVSFAAADGAQVKAGDLIATMEDDELDAQRAGYASDVVELESRMFHAMEDDPAKIVNLRQRLDFARAQLARADQKLAELQIRAEADGVLVMPHQEDELGAFRKQGALLGYVLTGDDLTVRVALPQQDADLVRDDLHTVELQLADSGSILKGRVNLDTPAAVNRLPSAALGNRAGGPIQTDADDKDGLKTRSPVVLLDVSVPGLHVQRVGERALVRFEHGRSPLLAQGLRRLQQLVLHSFNPET